MSSYILQHKNDEIAEVQFRKIAGLEVVRYIDKSLLLPRPAGSDLDLNIWWNERAIPRSRENIRDIFPYLNLYSTRDYLLQNLGLSLNDCYWVRPKELDIRWEDVNLFRGNWADDSADHSSLRFTPDASTGGDLPKWWIEDTGSFYLLKGNSIGSRQQSFNEVFASNIHASQGFTNYIPYTICNISQIDDLGCCSKCFTSENVEYISAWDAIGSHNFSQKESVRERFFSFAEKEGLDTEYIQKQIDYMNLTDFILSNTDRHLNNFGFLRDANTLKYIGLAPIFDTGNSMFYKAPYNASLEGALKEKLKGFYSSSKNLVAHIKNLSLIDTDKLPTRQEVKDFYAEAEISDNAANHISLLFEEKKRIIEELQRGNSYYTISSRYFKN